MLIFFPNILVITKLSQQIIFIHAVLSNVERRHNEIDASHVSSFSIWFFSLDTTKLSILPQRYDMQSVTGSLETYHHVWASYQIRKIAGCACAGNTGNVSPLTDFKGNC